MPALFAYYRLPIDPGAADAYRAACRANLEQYAAERLPGLEWAAVVEEEAKARKKPFGQRSATLRLQLQLGPGDHVLVADTARAFRSWADLLEAARVWR